MRRPSVRDEIEGQGARPTPREFSFGPWIAIAIILGLLFWAMTLVL
jgi:hypothetical protein